MPLLTPTTILAGLVATVAARNVFTVARSHQRTWAILGGASPLVAEHGFEVTHGAGIRGVSRVYGTIDGVEVRLIEDRGIDRKRLKSVWTLELRPEPPLPLSVSVRPYRAFETDFSDDYRSGDPAFDQLAQVSGAALDSFVVLEHEARTSLSQIVESGGRLENSVIYFDDHTIYDRRHSLCELVVSTVKLLAPLRRNQELAPVDLLVKVAANDSSIPLREAALQYLPAYAKDHEGASALMRAAVLSRNSATAAWAAANVGIEARQELRQLFASAVHTEAARAAALTTLVRVDGDTPSTTEAVRLAWSQGEVALRVAALGAAAALELPDLSTWIGLAIRMGVPKISYAAAELLVSRGNAELEPSMILLLGSSDELLFEFGASALTRHGTLAAVPRLFEIVNSSELSHDRRASARVAMQQIQSRAGAAHAGAIAIVDAPTGTEGAISLAADTAIVGQEGS